MTRKSCEERLFSSNSCDFISDSAVVFYNCELKEQVGEFPAGTEFGGILVDPERSMIVLQNFNEDGSFKDEFQFELEYRVGDKIVA